MKKHYVLPGLWERNHFLIPLLSLYKNNRSFFYDDIEIDAVFGNFCHLIWDGGRPDNTKNFAYLEDIITLQKIYNNILNISMRFVCSNPLIQIQDCKDKFGNLILSLCEDSLNSIIIRSSILEEYIRENYPKYNFISSTTKCLNNNDDIIKELEKNYLYVCLPYTKNYDITFLSTIPKSLLSKVELLINEKCNIDCPNRFQHYIDISRSNYSYDFSYSDNFICFNDTIQKRKNNSIIPYFKLDNYLKLNINHFKLEGRCAPGDYIVLSDILSYCIKPEWNQLVFRTVDQWMQDFTLNDYKLQNYIIN